MSGTDLAVCIAAILGVVAIVVSVCVLADRIHAHDPSLGDEAIYQWARKIVGAEMQAITAAAARERDGNSPRR